MTLFNVITEKLPGGKYRYMAVEGNIVILPNSKGFTLFLHQDATPQWIISEKSSGAQIASGKTSVLAIATAIIRLEQDDLSGAVEKWISEYGKAPEVTK